MPSQTSDRISSIAARYANITPARLIGLAGSDATVEQAASDIRSMAASLIRQDETKGLRGIGKRVREALHLK